MTDGTCQFKRDSGHDCRGQWVGSGLAATAICNMVGERGDNDRAKHCPRWYREHSLKDIMPKAFCCIGMENLFHDCAEELGFIAGGFDLRKYPNDGKDVWRNYVRLKFTYCPFCGVKIGEPL